MNRIRMLAPVVTAVAVALVLIPPGVARADGEITDVGWWTRLPTASAPEGGFAVGSAIDGPNSVAAVRVDLGTGLSQLSISATEAGGAPELAVIRACPAADGWTPAHGAALEDAPEIDCTNSIRFTRADDGVWTADVTALITGRTGPVSIGLQAHGPSGDGPLSVAPSEVQFEAPSATGTPLLSSPPTTETGPAQPRVPGSSPPNLPTATPPLGGQQTPAVSPATTVLDLSSLESEDPAAEPEAAPTTTQPDSEDFALGTVTAADVAGGGGRPIGEAFVLVLLAGLAGLGVGGVSKLVAMRAT